MNSKWLIYLIIFIVEFPSSNNRSILWFKTKLICITTRINKPMPSLSTDLLQQLFLLMRSKALYKLKVFPLLDWWHLLLLLIILLNPIWFILWVIPPISTILIPSNRLKTSNNYSCLNLLIHQSMESQTIQVLSFLKCIQPVLIKAAIWCKQPCTNNSNNNSINSMSRTKFINCINNNMVAITMLTKAITNDSILC